MRAVIGTSLLVELLFATTASSQDTLHVREGQRIRVSTRSAPEWQVGTVISQNRDTIVIRTVPHGEILSLPRADVAQLDTSTGPGHPGFGALGGAAIGLVAGGLGGALVGKFIASRDRARNNCPDGDCELVELITVPVGGAIGAIAGMIIGSQAGGEHWDPVPLYLSAGVGPRGGERFSIRWHRPTSWLAR